MQSLSQELINGETSLVGVIGDPVKHSFSPAIHNAALKALNLNWCYLAIPCNKNNLELVLKALGKIDCKGLNITIPHKVQALKICNRISPLAKEIGSVNTLIQDHNGEWNGANTDVEGFLAPLKDKGSWEGKEAVILGCGGSAKAVVHGLRNLKVTKVTIIGRKLDSLNKFLCGLESNDNKSTEINGLMIEDLSISKAIRNAKLIVNTTPVGMNNNLENEKSIEIPLGKQIWNNLQPGTILYDLIYTPRPTEWLKLGDSFSCEKIDGLEMLIQQGAASLRLWSGIQDIPIKIMRKAAAELINK